MPLWGFSKNTAKRLVDTANKPHFVPQKPQPTNEDFPRLAIFLTPSGGIPARSGTDAGSAVCTLVTLKGNTLGTPAADEWKLDYYPWATGEKTLRVGNVFSTDIAGSTYVVAAWVADGAWVVIAEDCGA